MANTMRCAALAALLVTGSAVSAAAQQPQPGGAASAPDTGTMAPDFTLPGATRYGLLAKPIKLSEMRGTTIVLAFFPKARTRG